MSSGTDIDAVPEKYQYLFTGSEAVLSNVSNGALPGGAEFVPSEYKLPANPSRGHLISVVTHNPNFSYSDFFSYVTAIGPVLQAKWTPTAASVTFNTTEDTTQCFWSFVSGGYTVAILGQPLNGEFAYRSRR